MMSVIRRTFSTRAMRVHGAALGIVTVALASLDWAQGVDSETTFLGLDWAHLVFVIWVPIFVAHALASWWGGEIDELDDETMRDVRGRWI